MNSHRTRDVPRPLERLLRRVESAFAFSNIWQRPSFAEAQQGTLPYMGGSLPYNRHTSAVLRPVKALVRRASAERGVQPRRRSARVRRDRGHGSRGSLFWRCS